MIYPDNTIRNKFILNCCFLLPFVVLFAVAMFLSGCGEKMPKTSRQSLRDKYFLRGSFELETNLPEEPRVKVKYLLPCDPNGALRAEAADIIYYAPAAHTRSAMDRTEIQECAARDCSIFSFDITSDMDYAYDRVRAYHRLSSGWDKVVFGALKKIQKIYNLPERKLLILGESTGSSMAAEYMCVYGEKIDAVALLGTNHRWDTIPSAQIATLFLNTWGCYGEQAAQELADAYRQVNPYVLSVRTDPPWASLRRSTLYHVPNQDAYLLAVQFLTDFASLRRKNQNQFPAAAQWPVQQEMLGETYPLSSTKVADRIADLPWVQLKRYHAGESGQAQLHFPAAPGREYRQQEKTILLFDRDPSNLFFDLNIIHHGKYYGYDVLFQNHIPLSPASTDLLKTSYSAVCIGDLAIASATFLLENDTIVPTQLLLIAPDPVECELFLEKWKQRSALWRDTELHILFIKENYSNSLWTESTCDFKFPGKGEAPYWDRKWFDLYFAYPMQ